MPSQSISHDLWLGKLVWFFPRDHRGLPIGNSALCGIVIDKHSKGVYIVMCGEKRIVSWEADMELVEEWSEDLEGENGAMEKAREGPRGHDRHSPE